ncbi:beta-lactamase superfamily domain-containing protein [Pochonia chlamydosporia 170]|uniref:Beta-lactamase superfamily domain-containing protein n=1 Tax=Pochonia chlamydosporia 170 TaxID=1380566 RepID=A0A179EZF9_METCM|nr:beta-lactamase superfamily domain-containing protein [Pochonia chlamydosporia 170]OAQ58542.1 beta-lactamase superfamily domain-containing protein [Pochonia chlamydosporia 170]
MVRQLEVLGCQAAYPTADQPCSSLLLTWDSIQIVLDLGYGTLKGLLDRVPDGKVNAIIITHDHPDHWIDLHGLFRLLYYGPRTDDSAKISIYCTAGVVDKMRFLESDVDLEDVFTIHKLQDGKEFTIGNGAFRLDGFLLPHHVENIGIRLSVQGDGNLKPLLAYTGDTGPSPTLEMLGKDVSLFIMDSTDRPGEEKKANEDRKLLQSEDAGMWAAVAGAQRLLLTHFWPTNDRKVSLERAKARFDGDVFIAEPGLVLEME